MSKLVIVESPAKAKRRSENISVRTMSSRLRWDICAICRKENEHRYRARFPAGICADRG